MKKAPTKIITKKSKAQLKKDGESGLENRPATPSYKKDRKHKTFKATMKV